ncbi:MULTISPECIES: DUF192 domain-containing protein [unclassified Thioalkalivibrio]|uniref:DUF192 domain-containing protein n=1 Tax=unclassified Thioalkalivibrio TaxID=2621013 RepID=UPI00035C0F64|nr:MULTISPECIES: DUF192 domain-containing protein [unclassified Thioalkalivibrio]
MIAQLLSRLLRGIARAVSGVAIWLVSVVLGLALAAAVVYDLSGGWRGAPEDLAVRSLEVGGVILEVEIAQDERARRAGLMFREHLPANHGMLFIWDESDWRSMWMRNTYIPLDVAFIDDNGVIVNIETMEPETRRQHRSVEPVPYALEANAGWFSAQGVEAGDRVPALSR